MFLRNQSNTLLFLAVGLEVLSVLVVGLETGLTVSNNCVKITP